MLYKNSLVRKKRRFRIFLTIIYILLLLILIAYLYDALVLGIDIYETIFLSIVFLIYTYCLWMSYQKAKKYRPIKYLESFCDTDELFNILKQQNFRKLNIDIINNIYESNLWYKIDGYFIPKNFILGAYSNIETARYGQYIYIYIVLITGQRVVYPAGSVSYNCKNPIKDKVLNALEKELPHANCSQNNTMRSWYHKNKKEIISKFENYILQEKDIFKLINNWEDIIGYKFDSSIDDSELYFKEYSNKKN